MMEVLSDPLSLDAIINFVATLCDIFTVLQPFENMENSQLCRLEIEIVQLQALANTVVRSVMERAFDYGRIFLHLAF